MNKITLFGVVQGVGMRPFVYTLAQKLGLVGFTRNAQAALEIVLPAHKTESFLNALKKGLPPLALVEKIIISPYDKALHFNDFRILESKNHPLNLLSQIPKDLGVCEDCLREIRNKNSPYFHYAFNSCAKCGARYSLLNAMPYDRENSALKPFKLCGFCTSVYKDATNKRFHIQGISCKKCGIALNYKRFKNDDALLECAKDIQKGKIIALKGLGGFALLCDARNFKTIERLRLLKNRPLKPFALMFKDLNAAKQHAFLNALECESLNSVSAPILLARKKPDTQLAPNIAKNSPFYGVILPYTPLHALLLDLLDSPIVFTSANFSSLPLASDEKEIDSLHFIFDFKLTHNRAIIHRIDDSIAQRVDNAIRPMRLARGFAPLYLTLPKRSNHPQKKILALGAEQKGHFSLLDSETSVVLLSPFCGDLSVLENEKHFKETLNFFLKTYDFKPTLLACDKHQNYTTTKMAFDFNTPLLQVQHHHAHFLASILDALLQDPHLNHPFIGIVWDGSGAYENKVYGAECFVGDLERIEEVARFEEFWLLGGQKAIKEPRRLVLEIALKHQLNKLLKRVQKHFKEDELGIFKQMHDKKIQSVATNSIGRLFDIVAFSLDLVGTISFEAESGQVLENLALQSDENAFYPFEIKNSVVRLKEFYQAFEKDLGVLEPNRIAKKFFNSLVEIITALITPFKGHVVVCSGGVFCNQLLCEQLAKRFKKLQREYFFHKHFPPNDSSIPVGQALMAYFNPIIIKKG
ncbi:carbamoyltransferase HypF [Helicobacter pylori]|uniref:carbamoyltransferase HypF n=1 Tax=Helicobacter pylori TaxID=210 RepID=UPI0001E37B83|nr:carbamoyltransferase HypF [Helicobacter pylori]ADN79184.1 NiFe-hydrogenase metallocenter assembly protein [Helicobacter pylori 908]ADZ49126.1 hydrogenase maturation protein [Helicobacter pylori 2017]ADZ50725.1 NiFe hydrogenase metallocenter assembly protein [Helicobacter pylori 2018]